MNIQMDQVIDVPLKEVWQIFGHEFGDIQKWSSFVQSSAAKTDGPGVGDADFSGRTCETALGPLDESLQIFRNDTHEVKFLVKGTKFPFFMRSILSHWRFSDENGKTRARTDVTLNLVFPFNILMGWALRRNFTKTLKGVADELESYAKTRLAA